MSHATATRPGLWFPLGATIRDGGANFAVASGTADRVRSYGSSPAVW